MKPSAVFLASLFLIASGLHSAIGKPVKPVPAGPPVPVLATPASGASLAQPITLGWNPVSAANGPIGSYTWQVGTSSTFSTIIASGFQNIDSDPDVPTPTSDRVSGLPNGIYFWRVRATQLTDNGGLDSAWSAVRTFRVTGLGAAPAAPSFISPANDARIHVNEAFNIEWTAVAGAQYYVLEADEEPRFSFPINLTAAPITFGTLFGAGWGNAIPNIYYRVRAVSADGVRSLPSATLAVHITDSAPVPQAVAPISPATGATVSLPFSFDWSDTPNPALPSYQVDVNTSSNFGSSTLALSVPGVFRSDYLVTEDLLAPGNYFWRVRALHGNVAGPWSASRALKVTAGPPKPTDVNLFAILARPINAYGGNSTQARVILDNPAPAGGAVVTIGTNLPQVKMPSTTVTIPAGKTDATITPILTGPVPNNGLSVGIIGDLIAAYAGARRENSLGVLPILYGMGLSNESVVGGTSLIGTVTLLSPAPPGGTTIKLVSSDNGVVQPPATIIIPEGRTDADFAITTRVVAVPVRVYLECGTEVDGFRTPGGAILVTPAGGSTPPARLSSLTLSSSSVPSGGTVTGTVRLTAAAPVGGLLVRLNASAEGQVVAPTSITVPEGEISASFVTSAAPAVAAPLWVLVQAFDATSGGSQARVLEINPAPGAPTLLAIGPAHQNVIGGRSGRASLALVIPAPQGGGAVTLSTDNPTYIHVPSSITVPEGNSAVSFPIATRIVSTFPTGGRITATAGGVTRSIFVDVNPDPNAPPILRGIILTPSSVVGGSSSTGTVLLNSPAPPGGIQATLSTSNLIARPVPITTVPEGQTSATFTVTTSAVSTNTVVTITAFVGSATRSANLTVTR